MGAYNPHFGTIRAAMTQSKGSAALRHVRADRIAARLTSVLRSVSFEWGLETRSVNASNLQTVKQELVKAGLEIYRATPSEIEIAERVRLHIMDSGVRVRADLTVVFTVRTQRSDFGSGISADQLFEKVREAVGREATDRGYAEEAAHVVEMKDPMDDQKILDTWHEVVYAKPAEAIDDVIEEVRWALEVEKYVSP